MKDYFAGLSKPGATIIFVAFISLSTCMVGLSQSQTEEAVAALEGLDPVMLVQGKEVQGSLKITVTRGGFQYFFANEEDKATFEKEPAHYEIQLNGMCARMGAPVTGNPDLYTVHKGRIYIFGSGECKKRFEAAPEKFLEDEIPMKPNSPSSAEALKKGQDLIEKAVKAMGSPAIIDSLNNYQEKSLSLQRRHEGEVEVKTNLTILFPDRVRADQVMPDFANPSVTREVAIVITATDAFAITREGSRPMPGASREVQHQELNRRPLAILRARRRANFKATAIGTANVGETAVERVEIDIDRVVHTLGIDPTTGRILSLSYRRRGPVGEFGQVVKVFSDFRAVNGVTLPFKVTASFNGEPWIEQSATIESITINGKIDAALFERSKQGKVD